MPSKTTKKVTKNDNVETEDKDVITMDRRTEEERREGNPEALDVGAMSNPRRKKNRRRHIDPTTCERDYNNQEIEFMRAMDEYKRNAGRMFPTCSEVLEVIRSLGYVQLTQDDREYLGLEESETWQPENQEVDAEEAELQEALEG